MKKLTFFTGLFLAVALISNSCSKKDRGCTDPDSVNYDKFAEKDDGSCRYEGYAVIWYERDTSEGLIADGATALKFYLDDQLIGSSAAGTFWADQPDCGDNGSVSVTKDLGKEKKKKFTLSVRDQVNFEYWNTPIDMEGNTCLSIELTWGSRKKK
ncbi:MAG TPA: hypothetical protein VHO50_00915 [Bacteroidales bacterium]|nr:hypothetical protein [Bacteroidales bacterium]